MSIESGDDFEERLHSAINNHKDLYFQIEATDTNFEQMIDEAYENLKKIKILMDTIYNINTSNLLSNFYISNRKKIREENDQYRLEIKFKTQCLKKKNKIQIQDNLGEKRILFNQVPFQHFKYIGIAPGEYEIEVGDEYPMGIMYDFEEYPNKEHGYDVLEQNLIISGDEPYGEPITFTEDKYIVAPGDILGDESSEAYFNQGPHEFRVQFYTGTVKLNVLGDFGIVSYYFYNYGYMGGQKRFKFSDICLIER